MAASQDIFDDWKPLLEWEEDRRHFDTQQALERDLVIQKGNGTAGVSVGGPRDAGYSEPLMRKDYGSLLPDDMDSTATYDLD